jgi:hypothetical protein
VNAPRIGAIARALTSRYWLCATNVWAFNGRALGGCGSRKRTVGPVLAFLRAVAVGGRDSTHDKGPGL